MKNIYYLQIFILCFCAKVLNFIVFFFSAPLIIKSKFGKPKMYFSGHTFNLQNPNALKQMWRCVKWSSPFKCRSQVQTVNGIIVRYRVCHTHWICDLKKVLIRKYAILGFDYISYSEYESIRNLLIFFIWLRILK